jgi:hypothetical protein
MLQLLDVVCRSASGRSEVGHQALVFHQILRMIQTEIT